MRRQETKFASPQVLAAASRLAPTIRLARLSRNMTQAAAAERAKMSAFTWMKIERGDVSVSMGSWLSALECMGLLDALNVAPAQGPAPVQGNARLRARPNAGKADAFNF